MYHGQGIVFTGGMTTLPMSMPPRKHVGQARAAASLAEL
jgi:hypothetical protein